MASPIPPEDPTGDNGMDLMALNAKSAFDLFILEAMAGARAIRGQQEAFAAASIDNVRNLQQAHADNVRAANTVQEMTVQGTKILQEKGLDTTAHEIAAETASVAAALAAMNGANRQTDSTTAALSQQLAQMDARISAVAAAVAALDKVSV